MQEKKKVQVLQLSAWVPLKSLQSKQESYGSQGSQEINPFNRMKSTSTVSGNKIKNNFAHSNVLKGDNVREMKSIVRNTQNKIRLKPVSGRLVLSVAKYKSFNLLYYSFISRK